MATKFCDDANLWHNQLMWKQACAHISYIVKIQKMSGPQEMRALIFWTFKIELLWVRACSHISLLCQKLISYPNSVTIETSLTKLWLLNEKFLTLNKKLNFVQLPVFTIHIFYPVYIKEATVGWRQPTATVGCRNSQ